MSRKISLQRKTKETELSMTIDPDGPRESRISLGIPFMEHLLGGMGFHGGFYLEINGTGDLEVDYHHTVEDIGILLGAGLQRLSTLHPIARFGHGIIPMDDALSEVTIDSGGRAFLVYKASYPQHSVGSFDLCLIREFLTALSQHGKMNIHARCHYGENSHHQVEALFKALGVALAQAYRIIPGDNVLSTKGNIDWIE